MDLCSLVENYVFQLIKALNGPDHQLSVDDIECKSTLQVEDCILNRCFLMAFLVAEIHLFAKSMLSEFRFGGWTVGHQVLIFSF